MNPRNQRNPRIVVCFCFFLPWIALAAQEPHARPQKQEVPGKRIPLSCTGRELTLYLPPGLKLRDSVPLAVHFHGAIWVAEWNLWRSGKKAALLPIHIGVGSRVYRQAFADPEEFGRLLSCAEAALGHKVGKVVLTSFSAGYGAIAEILAVPRWRDRVAAVLLADSLHSSYAPEGQPGKLNTEQLRPFAEYQGELWAMHSQIVPGAYASTTETTDYLIQQHGARRRPARRAEHGMRLLSRADLGRFHVRGYAGDGPADHMDHFYAMGAWLKKIGL